ncbi:MAG: hypothetical protein AABW64_03365 [Nanoarchaeota archaeon]
MVDSHKIIEKVETGVFIERIKYLKKEDVEVSDHAVFRVKKAERKAFKDEIIDILLHENPLLVGIQRNKNYAVYYKYKSDTLKMILDMTPKSIKVVTVYIVDNKQVPRL